MFEEIIAMLDDIGVDYTEDFETGQLVIDIGPVEKLDVINIIAMLVDLGEPFDIDEASITVAGGEIPAMEDEETLDLDAMLDDAM